MYFRFFLFFDTLFLFRRDRFGQYRYVVSKFLFSVFDFRRFAVDLYADRGDGQFVSLSQLGCVHGASITDLRT